MFIYKNYFKSVVDDGKGSLNGKKNEKMSMHN